MTKYIYCSILSLLVLACNSPKTIGNKSILDQVSDCESIPGSTEYLNTPYVTAGDRIYMVGNQDGSFPDLGWHVEGEMGGIWDHPIKLMDGFTLGVVSANQQWCLNDAEQFINYPIANRHEFQLGEELSATRVQFVPDGIEGIVVEYTFQNFSENRQELNLNFTGMVDLTPVWLSEELGVVDGYDLAAYDEELGAWIARDSLNEWYTVFGTNQNNDKWFLKPSECHFDRKGKGIDASLSSTLEVPAEKTAAIRYFITGSYQSKGAAIKSYQQLTSQYQKLLKEKIDRYQRIEETASLTIPDSGLQQLFTWTKYNTDWLIRDVPEEGRGLSAGIPDYPWWFGTDNTYALRGLLATGQHEEVKNTINLILKLSRKVNNNGRIMHEASTNGVVFNPGNLNTTPYFIDLLWKYYEWTGDKELLEETYPDIQDGLKWLESQDEDGNGYPDGAGMMEIHGLHSEMVDVVVYTQAAYVAASKIALELDDQDQSISYKEKAESLANKINEDWWVGPANSFADFRASRVKTLQLIKEAIIRADTLNKPWAVEELQQTNRRIGRLRDNRVQGHVVHHNWVVNTPMETGVADREKAVKALETARKYTNQFGMYVTGIDRDEQQDKSSKWKAFSYVGAVMTLPTGVQAIAEANYGFADNSLKYLKSLNNSFSYALPGSMYEVSPDYGMIAQAWNIYAVATPIIEKFFGISPAAYKKTVEINPQFPSSWDEAELKNLIVGDNQISINKKKDGYAITQSNPNWTLIFHPETDKERVFLNDEETPPNKPLILTGEENTIRFN